MLFFPFFRSEQTAITNGFDREILKLLLSERYHFDCQCLLCTNEYWSILAIGINCTMDPLYNDAVEPILIRVKALREMTMDDVEKHERAAIAFLKKFDNLHPNNDTNTIQKVLQVIWTLFATRFDFPLWDLTNSDYITRLNGEILFATQVS